MAIDDVERAPRDVTSTPPSFQRNKFETVVTSESTSPQDAPKNSFSGTLYNLVKTSIGCGMIFLPRAMHNCGLIFGMFFIALSGLVTLIPQILLSHMSVLGVSDYISLSRKCYGKFMETSIVLFQLLILFTPMIAYIKLNGMFASSFLMSMGIRSDSIFANPSLLTVLISILVMLPLCLLKNLSKLSFASVLGLICVSYLSLLTILDYLYDSWLNGGFLGISLGINLIQTDIRYFGFGLPLMSAFNAFMLAYTNHPSILPLLSEMKNPTSARRAKLIHVSQSIVFVFYLLTTTTAYLHFGTLCEDSISYIVLKKNIFYLIAQLLVVFVNIITFPLIHWPARLSLDWLLRELIKAVDANDHTRMKKSNINAHSLPSAPARKYLTLEERFDRSKNIRHVLEAMILIFVCCLLAIVLPSILSVFDFFMPISGSFVLFTIPSLCYLKCLDKGFIQKRYLFKVLAYLGLATGVLHFVIGFTSAVFTYII